MHRHTSLSATEEGFNAAREDITTSSVSQLRHNVSLRVKLQVNEKLSSTQEEPGISATINLPRSPRLGTDRLHVTGQTKSGSEAHHEKKNIKDRYTSPGLGVTGAPPWSQAWGWGSAGERLVAGSLPTGPGRAQPEMATWARLPVGSPPRRKVHEGPVQCGLGSSSRGREPRRPNPWNKTLAIGTWNVTSLGGKEPELVREVERYRLEIVGLTSTHSLGSGIQLLERGWTLHYSGVAQGERRASWCGACSYSSPAQPPRVGVHPGEQRVRFPAPSGWG
ncbi:hypothetical protein L3Q82_002502 [Scortum barcoo]|uniref:Uncharacterized protein n=1 Tax=Scortum barcoo TaxID=214431 RepID=A0ACB8W0C2_9TELE|nr:hypothetical protein L3Q82_002502 [Scortum barcoo]